MNRTNLLYKLDNLLAVCETCDRKKAAYNNPKACEGCETHSQFLAIGKQLENMNRERKTVNQKLVLEIETYMKLKGQGKTDAEIAKQFGIKQPTLIYYKKKWVKEAAQAGKSAVKQPEPAKAKEPENQPKDEKVEQEHVIQVLQDSQKPILPEKAEEKKAACNCLKDEQKAEYESLIAALRSDLTEAHKQLDERDEKIRNLEHLHDACEDCENEISSLQQAKEELERKLSQVQEIDNLKYAKLEAAEGRLKELEEENQAMRQLIKKWA